MNNHKHRSTTTRQLLGCLLLVLIATTARSQQLGTYAIYRDHFQMINPAALNHFFISSSGHQNNFNFNAGYRQQWLGLEGAPMSFNARFEHLPDGLNMKWGLFFSHDEIFATSNDAIYGNYAYIIPIDKRNGTKLALGLNLGLVLQTFDFNKITFADNTETAQDFLRENQLYSDLAIGAFFMTGRNPKQRFYAGISSLQTFTLDLNEEVQIATSGNERVMHIYGIAGKTVGLGQGLLETSIWLRFVPGSAFVTVSDSGVPLSSNVNLTYTILSDRYNKAWNLTGFWVGVGGGTTREVSVEGGYIQNTREDRVLKIGAAYIHYLAGRLNLGPTLELTTAYSF